MGITKFNNFRVFENQRNAKKFIAYLEQEGEGCDYTIGCGLDVIEIDASNMEEAIEKLTMELDESFSQVLSKCVLYEVSQTHLFDLKGFYDEQKRRYDSERELDNDERDRIEFERLKAKFGK